MSSIGTQAARVGKQIVATVTADTWESERLAKRAELRRQLAEREVLQGRLDSLSRQIGEYHRQGDRAADEHSAACGPLQNELATLDQQTVELLSQRQPVPPSIEQRRAEILATISQHNETLADVVARVERLVRPLEKERLRVQLAAAEFAAVESKLVSEGVAAPALRASLFSNQKRMDAAWRRVEEARKQLTFLGPALSEARVTKVSQRREGWTIENAPWTIDRERVRSLQRQHDAWTCELQNAESELAAAKAEGERLGREMLEE